MPFREDSLRASDHELAEIAQQVAEAPEPDFSSHPLETARAYVQMRLQFLEQYRNALTLSEVYKRMKEPDIAARHAEAAAKARAGVVAVEEAVNAQSEHVRHWYSTALELAKEEFAAKADAARDALAAKKNVDRASVR